MRQQPPVDEFPESSVTIHGYKRAYRRAGRGDALLLIHGIGDSSATWLPVLPALSKQFDCIAPDLLGHGDSDKPRADYSIAAYACGMRDLLDVLGVESVTVVGHSLGGGIAAQFAYQFPERISRLVLVGSGGVGREVNPILRLAAGPAADMLLPVVTSGPVKWAVRQLRPLIHLTGGLGLGHDLNEVLDKYAAVDGSSRGAFLRTLRAGVDSRGQAVTMLDRAYLAAAVPTLLIWGENDGMIPSSHADIAHQAMPGSWMKLLERGGHFPHHDDPDWFVEQLEHFIAETEPVEFDRDRWRAALLAGRAIAPVQALRPVAAVQGASGS